MGERIVGALSLAIWLYLAAAHGRFWRTSITLPRGEDPGSWPSVVAVVPARDEAQVLPLTLPTLLAQRYPGPFRVVVVDDDSGDSTGELAAAAGADVVRGGGPPPGWAGKVAAMATGVEHAGAPDYLLFTDADIAYPPDAVTALVRAATANRLDLTSQMVRLRAESFWERLIVPAFVYFFAQLYPFARVNGAGGTAAAAGGCMLVRRAALAAAGGLPEIRGAVIDDVSLGRLLKRRGRIWLGLSEEIVSVRPYPHLRDLWDMVARSAYTQLRHSPVLLAGTVVGLLLTYVVPPAALVAGFALGDWVLAALGGIAWLVMAATFVPILRHYRLAPWRALLLPATAVLYVAMTVDSARRHRAGRGAAWKGRVATRG
ncbi:MAG TPA: glycosyltransferase [Jatrophihabitantaceae bacterium]|nr:glycosyltransferase [Jatrophihabitantaceae bacterium]